MDAKLIAFALLLAGCSTPDEPATCGGPAAEVTLRAKTNAGNSFVPAPDVVVTWSECGQQLLTDGTGAVHDSLPIGRTYAPRLSRYGLTTTLWPEVAVQGPMLLEHLVLRDSLGPAYGLTKDASLLWVKVLPGKTCTSVEGVELAIEGHPEAKVEYLSGEGAIDLSLHATTTHGTALIRGLSGKVQVRATKAGCTLNRGPWGAVPLEAGVMSAVPLYLE